MEPGAPTQGRDGGRRGLERGPVQAKGQSQGPRRRPWSRPWRRRRSRSREQKRRSRSRGWSRAERSSRTQGTSGGAGRGRPGRRGQRTRKAPPSPRPSLPRANLEPREHTATLVMDEFQTLPTEDEVGQWMEREAFKEDVEALDQVLEGFKAMTMILRTKKIMMTMSNDAQLQTFLTVMMKEGERGRLWPGLGQEVRVRVEARMGRSMDIIVLNVDPESNVNLVRQAMEKYGEVRRCERMKMSGRFHRVVVNKVKVELVRNETRLPNIIHAFGTTNSPDDFATWKMEYRGCQRYCYGCGATSHEARQGAERGTARGRLERMASVVGEEQEETGEPQPLSYAAVLKDPTFLARQKK